MINDDYGIFMNIIVYRDDDYSRIYMNISDDIKLWYIYIQISLKMI